MALETSGRLRALAVLGAVCAFGGAAVVPYQLQMAPMDVELPLPVPAVALVSGLQVGVLCTVLGGLGWWAAGAVGLPTPLLDRLAGEGDGPARGTLVKAALVGALLAACIVPLDLFVLLPALPPSKVPLPEGSPFLGLLASVYGGVNEEVLTRLFLVSVGVWGLSWPARRAGRPAPTWAFVVAILGSAGLFGALHLPTAAMLWDLTPLVVGRILLLNVALAVPFGWLYWRWGLVAAMVAHFCADLVLHVLTPVLT